MEFRLLGPLEVRHDEHILKLGGPRQQAVLAALALSANRVVSIDHLTQAVWERAPASPASNLRTYVLGLRRLLRAGGERIQRLLTRPPGYLLRAEAGEVDVLIFDQLADRGSRALATGALPEATACLRYALALWRAGRPGEATDAYHAARHQLVDQLGVEPGEELRRLHAAVLTADPALRGPDRRD
jgi:DNA-binding SARP family transcriptional activator